MDYDAYDALLHHIFRQTQGDAWFKPSAENIHAGVCLRIQTGQYRVFPYENRFLEPFEAAVRVLNPVVAVKVRSAAVHVALGTVNDDATAIYVDDDTRIQILDSMPDLLRADKEQCGAFIRDERVLVVWSDNLDNIIPLCRDFEDNLIKLVWSRRHSLTSLSPGQSLAATPAVTSAVNSASDILNGKSEETEPTGEPEPTAKPISGGSLWGWRIGSKAKRAPAPRDLEKGGVNARPTRYFAPVYGGLGLALSTFFIGSGVSVLLQEFRLTNDFTRFALLSTAPLLFCVSLFFSLQVITNISYVFGPVAQYHENSKYYSAVKPAANKEVDAHLPHITVELPVYKESLEQTIGPSIMSIKKAMQTYARQGGTSAIFVHDDGLQLISEKEREERVRFYMDHGIGWVARPKHDDSEGGFKRRGRFKKASNMNYGLALSLRMEEHIRRLEIERGEKASLAESTSSDDSGEDIEEQALRLAVDETYEESGRLFKPWAHNAKALRIGEVILIVDSDTIVPEDCFRDAARELSECPEVAIIQHDSDVMQVAHHYFENGIAHFTRRINKCISMACANGEVAPFVGHNAFLRWSALQDAAFEDAGDNNKKKIWSETNVSEDFDMALRLQLKGYLIRWATYSEGGFKEGVSLTCDDELNRWQKYSYGCNELIFNPLIQWWRLGPINKQLRVFLWSNAPVHYKVSMMSYMFSYYGLAASALLSFINYLILGLSFNVDGFYEHSFEIWLACTVVFPGAGNIGYTLLEYRLGQRSLASSFLENITWIPFFFFFFGGLSIHLSQALLAHLFSYNIMWGATKKEVERSNFFIEVPRILRRFWLSLTISFFIFAMMVVLSTDLVPLGWQVPGYDWAVIFPLAVVAGSHILFPIVLNPWLMIFSY
ncbi:glycosyl transferase family group 2-domain-containing protein [Russula earlei]|uniref:Glycosyl transferase family group 2-domain-containing protein n=1 Tax=Russula earlei TaxID=71964 RepID=A0ACC0U375_9AGAM|nr:glycosyl transferase family group 2-domain-containing protein [Russula earlei]